MGIELGPAPAAADRHRTYRTTAEGLGAYDINVTLPAAADHSGQERYPVIVVLDGEFVFGAEAVHGFVHGPRGDVPAAGDGRRDLVSG